MKILRIFFCLFTITVLGKTGWAADIPQASAPRPKCSAYLIDQVAHHTKAWWALAQDPEILVDGEKIYKYLGEVQVALNEDFPTLENVERWDTFFNNIFNVFSEQIVDIFATYAGKDYPDPPSLDLMLALKNYIFLSPSAVLPVKVIAHGWLSQGVRWALSYARQLEQHSPAELSYLARILDQILPNFKLQSRDHAALIAQAQEAESLYAAHAGAAQAGLPLIIARKVELGSLLAVTKNFNLITAIWQTYVEHHYQDFTYLHPYSVDFANFFYALRQDVDYGSEGKEQAWSKFWLRYLRPEFKRVGPDAGINKYMLYTIWHGRGSEFDPEEKISDIFIRDLGQVLREQIKVLEQDKVSSEAFLAWAEDLAFALYGPKPPADADVVVPAFFQKEDLTIWQDWTAAGNKFLRQHQRPERVPNFLPLVAPEIRFAQASFLTQRYHFWTAAAAFDTAGHRTAAARPQLAERAARLLTDLQNLLGPKRMEVFLERYLTEQWRNFSDAYSDQKNRWIIRECLAGILQLTRNQYLTKSGQENVYLMLRSVAQRTLMDFLQEAAAQEYVMLGIGDFAYPGEEALSLINLIEEGLSPHSITSYYLAKPLSLFAKQMIREMQRFPKDFNNNDILAAEAVLLDLVSPVLYGEP